MDWIKCSDRLPEEGVPVIVTIRGTDLIVLEKGETLADAVKRTRRDFCHVSAGFYGSDGWYGMDGYPEMVAPIAWMPFPEPFKEEEE